MEESRVEVPADRLTLTPAEIRKLQRLLSEAFNLNVPADGMFGPRTRELAVRLFRENPTILPYEEQWLLQAAVRAADPSGPLEWLIPPVWIFYSKSPYDAEWLEPGTTVFWLHGRYPKGGAYKRRLRAGDTVLLLVGQHFIASGVLLADERLHFYDSDGNVCRPVRVLQRYVTPLSRAELEATLGAPVIRQGAVQPISSETLEWLNRQHEMLDASPLPYPEETLQFALSDRPLAEVLDGEAASDGVRPDEATAKAIGWSGEPWRPNAPAETKEAIVRPAFVDESAVPKVDAELEEDEAADEPAGADIDVQIPFVLDAPADNEDDLDRGPLALFLGRRLHLIWCQMNGHAPDRDGQPLPALPPDSDTFIAHVDSPWGGGKSTFANFVARVLDPRRERLTPKHFLRSSLAPTKPDGQLGAEPLQEVFVPPYALTGAPGAEKWPGARLPWIVARYNAWRDQYVQPPWWQIFLTLHATVAAEVRRDALVAFIMRGDGPGFRGLARWLGIHLTLFWYQVWNSKLKTQLGLWALVAILFLVLWQMNVVEYALGDSSTAPGADGTSPLNPKTATEWIALAVAILGLGGASIATLFTVLSQSFSPDLDFTSEHKHVGVRDPIRRFRGTFERILRATDRPVLLIVDDLDRCEPGTVVEIMRGFQTIIRSPRLFVLLLGDRAWIEGAHDVYHKDLLALGGDETKLGSLYVRKVIQLSFRLPVMNAESRKRFARRVLGEGDEAIAEQVAPVLKTVERRAREIATGAGSIGEKEAKISQVVADATQQLVELSESDKAAAVAAATDIADTQVVVAAGADTAQQREVFNAVTQLIDCLPNNPRQIKRIFMAFATYEQVGRRLFGYRLTATGPDGELQAKRWRQLAMWVTLAVEWPETWRAIARQPEMLKAAYAPKANRAAREKALLKGVQESERAPLLAVLRRLRADRSLVALLRAESGTGVSAEADEFARTAMEPDAVYEFNRIIWEPGFLLEPDVAA